MSARRVLVTGAGGFVGSWLVREALRAGWEVHALVRAKAAPRLTDLNGAVALWQADLRDAARVEQVVRECRPTCVAHTAFPAGHPVEPKARSEMLESGLLGTANLLEAVRVAGTVTHLVNAGSFTVYEPSSQPHRPSDPLRPASFRGACKAGAWLLCAQLGASTGVICSDVRLPAVYGPWEQSGRLVPQAIKAGLENSTVQLTREPRWRNWVHVQDAARACLAALAESVTKALVFNACSAEAVSTHQLVGLLEGIVGRKLVGGLGFFTNDPYGDPAPRGLPPEPGDGIAWWPEVMLPDGLAATWSWAQTAAGRTHLGVK
jgi:UDP-glucose 4-epimerase